MNSMKNSPAYEEAMYQTFRNGAIEFASLTLSKAPSEDELRAIFKKTLAKKRRWDKAQAKSKSEVSA